MSALLPNSRKLVVMQQQNKRLTRQVDIKRRKTLNSQNEIFFSNPDNLKKKKSKLNDDHKDTVLLKENNQNEIDHRKINLDIDSGKEKDTDLETVITSNNTNIHSRYSEDEKSAASSDNSFSGTKVEVVRSNEAKDFSLCSIDTTNQILGMGHLSILHAYVRDDLFQNIKILSNHHLETKGEIMQHCIKKLNYTESTDGNLTRFVNACRTEIRKTICSRRGYVKRQIGILMTGK